MRDENLRKLISDFFPESTLSQEQKLIVARRFFSEGYQTLLTVICNLYLAEIHLRHETENGLCQLVEQAFLKPTLGGLFSLLMFCCKNSRHPAMSEINGYFLKFESTKPGWFRQMLTLRNRFAHPKDEAPEDILQEALTMFDQTPQLEAFGNFATEADQLRWCSGGHSMELSPFMFEHEGNIHFLRELNEFTPIYTLKSDSMTSLFQTWWRFARVRDRKLANPSVEDLVGKIKALKVSDTPSPPPKWTAHLFETTAPGFLTDDKILNGILSRLSMNPERAIFMEIVLEGYDSVFAKAGETLGLRDPVTLNQINQICEHHKLVLGIRGSNLKPRRFLNLLFFLQDLIDHDVSKNFKLIISRNPETTQDDEEKLLDEMPSHLDSLLNRHRKSKAQLLSDFFWDMNEPEKTGSFIRKLFR